MVFLFPLLFANSYAAWYEGGLQRVDDGDAAAHGRLEAELHLAPTFREEARVHLGEHGLDPVCFFLKVNGHVRRRKNGGLSF